MSWRGVLPSATTSTAALLLRRTGAPPRPTTPLVPAVAVATAVMDPRATTTHVRSLVAVKQQKPVAKAPPPKPPATAAALKIQAGSRRVGAFGLKVGMLRLFDGWGVATPVTAVQLESLVVVRHKTQAKDGYDAVVLGGGPVKQHKINSATLGVYVSSKVNPRRDMREFRITPDAFPPVGAEIQARHFVPGQMVDVTGTTIGKGFQGAVKRWGFAGQPRSHGHSRSHRSMGGTGARQDPGKTWKGKRMHGRMGGKRRTVQNVVVFGVDPVRDLVFLKGHVPGHEGSILLMRDAVRVPWQFERERLDVPFPTFVGPRPAKKPEESGPSDWIIKPKEFRDPLAPANA